MANTSDLLDALLKRGVSAKPGAISNSIQVIRQIHSTLDMS